MFEDDTLYGDGSIFSHVVAKIKSKPLQVSLNGTQSNCHYFFFNNAKKCNTCSSNCVRSVVQS